MLVPAHNANACIVTKHAAHLLALSNIPDLNLTSAEANADVGTVARPLDAADIGVMACLQKAADAALVRRPDVDVALEANGDLIARAPVEKVQVVVKKESRKRRLISLKLSATIVAFLVILLQIVENQRRKWHLWQRQKLMKNQFC